MKRMQRKAEQLEKAFEFSEKIATRQETINNKKKGPYQHNITLSNAGPYRDNSNDASKAIKEVNEELEQTGK